MGIIRDNSLRDKGRVVSINLSKTKGIPKSPISQGLLIKEFGLKGDVHAGDSLRQVSLLAMESIEEINREVNCPKINKGVSVSPGAFAENITTQDIELSHLKINHRLRIGSSVILQVSKIGKDCRHYCSIYKKIGRCIMPQEGIFARVVRGGRIRIGDTIERIKDV